MRFSMEGGKYKGPGSKGKGKGKGFDKGKGAKGLRRKQGTGWPPNHLQDGKGKGKGKDSGKNSGNNSRDKGGASIVDLDELLQECERQGVNPMDREEKLKIERQLKSGPAQTFGDAQSAFQAAVKQRNHAKTVANDIAGSLARLMQQANQKRELLIKACDDLAAAEAKVSVEHVELGKIAREPPEQEGQDLPPLSPLSPLLEWHKWYQKDPTFAEEYGQWMKSGSLGPEPQWSQEMSCDALGVDCDDGLGEAMQVAHGEHRGLSNNEPGEWNPFSDPAAGSSEGIEMHQLGAPVMQPAAKAKGKRATYGSIAGKGQTARIEPYESPVEAILAAGENTFSGCFDALQQYKDTVAATTGPDPACG